MKPKSLITVLLLSALAVAVAFGAVIYSSARASAPTTDQVSAVADQSIYADKHGRGGGYRIEDLANALGISVDELTAAMQKAKDAVLAQAVEKGLITQIQVDRLKDKGMGLPLDMRRGLLLTTADLLENGIDYEAELAKALGISVEKLQEAYAQAFNTHLDQAVADGKLTQEQADLLKGQHALYADKNFQAAMQSAYQAAVLQAVKDGIITQAQADLILAKPLRLNFRHHPGMP